MYNIQENVRIVVSLLKEYNIHHIVINPGGTNIPVAQAVQDDPFFHCYSVPDERSAMYFAIGLHLQTGEVIATSCTSAQATRNYIPGLTEAFYKHTPIVAITTSKLERYAYQQYMQAPDQTSLPVDCVKKSYDLPPVTDENTRAQCCKLAKEAILESTHRNPGPVQINLRIIDTANSKYENVQLPNIRKVKRYMAWDSWDDVSLENKNVLIVVGEHRPFSDKQIETIEKFTKSHNAVVYVNHLSNYHGTYAINGNLLISVGGMGQEGMKPDVVITIGGQTGDYSIYGTLNGGIGSAEHWRICEDGILVDTYCLLTKIFECPFDFFFERLSKDESASHSYFETWKSLNVGLKRDVDVPFSNIYAAEILAPMIPQNSYINFAILNSLRSWCYFDLDPSIRGFGNVAAFGIDGCNSMLIGESMNTNELCFMITGDLAFFYDMNALGIRHIKNNVRILLINNHGGTEFRFMTKNWKYKHDVAPFTSADGHNGLSAKGWAENCGFEYISASNKKELLANSEYFVSRGDKSILFELFTDSQDELAAWDMFLSVNAITSPASKLKSAVAGIIGKDAVKIIKNILGK